MAMNLRSVLLALALLPLTACSSSSSQWDGGIDDQWDLAFRWSIKVAAPQHYEVWVDKFFVESLSENIGWRAPIGTVGCCWKSPNGGTVEWQTMPEVFIFEWFSFAEQQRYRSFFKLDDPEGLFEKMQEPAPHMWRGEEVNMPRYNLVLGLVPGGQVVVWIMNQAETAIEVGRYQSQKIDTPPNSYQNWIDDYQRDHGAYLEEHGLQLDKW